jgi:hypothetical protein
MTSLTDKLETDMTAEERDFIALMEGQPTYYEQSFGMKGQQIPAKPFVNHADPALFWHQPYGLDVFFGGLKSRVVTEIMLMPIFTTVFTLLRDGNHDPNVVDELYDGAVFRNMALEVLFRTDPRCRSLTFRESLRTVDMSNVFGSAERPGHNSFSLWHGLQQNLSDFTIIHAMCDAYNDLVPLLIEWAAYIVKDEIIIEKGSVIHLGKKPHQRGIEFLTDAMPVRDTGASVVCRMVAHIWRAGQGPNHFQMFKESVEQYWNSPNPALRPLVASDSRFCVPKVWQYVAGQHRGPFVFSISAFHHGEFVDHMHSVYQKAKSVTLPQDFRGCVTMVAGTEEYPHTPPIERGAATQLSKRARVDDVATACESSKAISGPKTTKEPRHQPARQHNLPAKLAEQDFVLNFLEAFGDDPSTHPAMAADEFPDDDTTEPTVATTELPSDMQIVAEAYKGLDDKERQKLMVLITNYVFGERQSPGARSDERDPMWPVYRLFKLIWRRVDQVNRFLKNTGLLHRKGGPHAMTETAAQADFVISASLQLSWVLTAKLEGKHTSQGEEPYTWENHGVRVARLLVSLSRDLGSTSRKAKDVCFDYFCDVSRH